MSYLPFPQTPSSNTAAATNEDSDAINDKELYEESPKEESHYKANDDDDRSVSSISIPEFVKINEAIKLRIPPYDSSDYETETESTIDSNESTLSSGSNNIKLNNNNNNNQIQLNSNTNINKKQKENNLNINNNNIVLNRNNNNNNIKLIQQNFNSTSFNNNIINNNNNNNNYNVNINQQQMYIMFQSKEEKLLNQMEEVENEIKRLKRKRECIYKEIIEDRNKFQSIMNAKK